MPPYDATHPSMAGSCAVAAGSHIVLPPHAAAVVANAHPIADAQECADDHEHYADEADEADEHESKRRRRVSWTATEDLAILATVRRLGTQWDRIAAQLPGRTPDAVRNRWHRLQRTHSLGDTEEGRAGRP